MDIMNQGLPYDKQAVNPAALAHCEPQPHRIGVHCRAPCPTPPCAVMQVSAVMLYQLSEVRVIYV